MDFQALIDQTPEGGTLVVPPGAYPVNNAYIPPNRQLSIIGGGAVLYPADEETDWLLKIGGDIRRRPLRVQGLIFDGRGRGVIGLSTDDQQPARSRTNLHVADCAAQRCRVGFDFAMSMNLHADTLAAHRSEVGVLLRQPKGHGGANANLLSNIEAYSNYFGVILDGSEPPWSMGNNVLSGLTTQDNIAAGLVVLNANNTSIINAHFENNGRGRKPHEYNGRTIEPCDVWAVDSSLSGHDMSLGGHGNGILAERSYFSFSGSTSYSAQQAWFLRGRECQAHASGMMNVSGLCNVPIEGDWTLPRMGLRFSYMQAPRVLETSEPLNMAPASNPPILANAIDAAVRTDTDPAWGPVSCARFAPFVGNTQSNRFTVALGFDELQTGEHFVVTFLARSDRPTVTNFRVTSGNYAFLETPLDERWKRVVLAGRAFANHRPALYAYAYDEAGAEVQLSHFLAYKGELPEVQRIMREGLFHGRC